MKWFIKSILSIVFGVIFITIIAILVGFPIAHLIDKLENTEILSLSGIAMIIILIFYFLDNPRKYKSSEEEAKEKNPFIK